MNSRFAVIKEDEMQKIDGGLLAGGLAGAILGGTAGLVGGTVATIVTGDTRCSSYLEYFVFCF